MCDCQIVPVLTDAQCRSVIRNTTDFDKKLEAVRASLGGAQVSA